MTLVLLGMYIEEDKYPLTATFLYVQSLFKNEKLSTSMALEVVARQKKLSLLKCKVHGDKQRKREVGRILDIEVPRSIPSKSFQQYYRRYFQDGMAKKSHQKRSLCLSFRDRKTKAIDDSGSIFKNAMFLETFVFTVKDKRKAVQFKVAIFRT